MTETMQGALVADPAFAIRLEEPTPAHRAAVEDYAAELRADGGELNGTGGYDLCAMPYDEWMGAVRAGARGEGLPEGWVPATTFLMVRVEDGQVVGSISVRHSIDNPYLSLYAGHIGYMVRPSARRRGYARQALTLTCRYARDALGIDRVMLGCDQGNEASWRTIRSCGGVLDRTFTLSADGDPSGHGAAVCTWWIDTAQL